MGMKMAGQPKFGLSCALSTPFLAAGAYGGAIDIERLIAHARGTGAEWL